jgi:hypothetical protein
MGSDDANFFDSIKILILTNISLFKIVYLFLLFLLKQQQVLWEALKE